MNPTSSENLLWIVTWFREMRVSFHFRRTSLLYSRWFHVIQTDALLPQEQTSDITMTEEDKLEGFASIQRALAFFLGRSAQRRANLAIPELPDFKPCGLKYPFLRGGLVNVAESLMSDTNANLNLCVSFVKHIEIDNRKSFRVELRNRRHESQPFREQISHQKNPPWPEIKPAT